MTFSPPLIEEYVVSDEELINLLKTTIANRQENSTLFMDIVVSKQHTVQDAPAMIGYLSVVDVRVVSFYFNKTTKKCFFF